MAVYWVHHYFALPVIFENVAMAEETPKQHHFDLPSQVASEQSPGMWNLQCTPTNEANFLPAPFSRLQAEINRLKSTNVTWSLHRCRRSIWAISELHYHHLTCVTCQVHCPTTHNNDTAHRSHKSISHRPRRATHFSHIVLTLTSNLLINLLDRTLRITRSSHNHRCQGAIQVIIRTYKTVLQIRSRAVKCSCHSNRWATASICRTSFSILPL